MEFANKADVDTLVLFHHDPYHTDDELEELLKDARRSGCGAEDTVQLAYEGMTIDLDARGTRVLDR